MWLFMQDAELVYENGFARVDVQLSTVILLSDNDVKNLNFITSHLVYTSPKKVLDIC